MTREELNERMANEGKTGLLIASETGRELLQANVEALEARLAEAREIIQELADRDPCDPDLNGYCWTHFAPLPDGRCANAAAREWLKK